MAYLTQYSNNVPVIKYLIDQSLMTIGQDVDMDICVPEEGIAENHAAVEVTKSAEIYHFLVKSKEEKSLLEINGKPVSHAELQDGDWLIIGSTEFQFTDDGVNIISGNTNVVLDSTSKPMLNNLVDSTTSNESEALKLIKELKEDLQDVKKPLTTKEFIANSRMSRRRLAF